MGTCSVDGKHGYVVNASCALYKMSILGHMQFICFSSLDREKGKKKKTLENIIEPNYMPFGANDKA